LTYNEATSLPALLDGVLAPGPRLLDLLVIDDSSPDGTAGVVRAHGAFGGRLHLIERDGKLGLGSAYREGFRWAVARGYDACVEIDADLSHDPADIPRLLDALDAGNDAALGSRYLGGLRVVNWPEHRLLLSAFATQFVRFFTGMPLSDATSGFKALRVAALGRVDPRALRAEGYGFQIELHHALWKSGARLTEVPITFTERRDGHTKMTAGIALEAMARVVGLAVSSRGAEVDR
jgi:dolichol-phosphate mannosyltransferase